MNSRPISLLTTLSKILQRVMFNILNQHLWVNNVFIPEQFGFRKDNTIENGVFILTNNILTVLGEQKQTAGIFCDLTKVFDCVKHDILLE
jgi:hypothetical protein